MWDAGSSDKELKMWDAGVPPTLLIRMVSLPGRSRAAATWIRGQNVMDTWTFVWSGEPWTNVCLQCDRGLRLARKRLLLRSELRAEGTFLKGSLGYH